MNIQLKLYCPGMVIDMHGRNMELREDATVQDLLDECLKIDGVTESIRGGSFMVNKQVARPETRLQDADEVILMRVLAGG